MNLKLIKKNSEGINFLDVKSLSDNLNLPLKFVELLYNRGVKTEQDAKKFLFPDERNLYDPFLMKDMKDAVARIEQAVSCGERVVVYGDYDVDGVCSSAILSLFLAERGVEVYTHIPSRITEGYGLNSESIERIIEECSPDLILTCDCGISACKEVENARDLGVDVIVTDHHEVSETLPDCIVVNPHRGDCEYPFKHLCGAGVALKLVQAMGGITEARKFWELAAVATIADLVPLVDENRLIVQLGLKTVNEIKNLGLKHLLLSQKVTGAITSADIAFKIAPRINAAGRMGDAYDAFRLLTTDDISKIVSIIDDINNDNNRRKEFCSKVYYEALKELENENLIDNRCVILSHAEWEKGITGIVAARLAGEFNRPAFILVRSGNTYKGTVRSIAEINIYDLLSEVSDLLVEFGGHSQAAGFSILPDNIEPFKRRVAQYLDTFPKEYFEPSMSYDIDIEEKDIDASLIKCLDLLEPTGNSNTKPLFRIVGQRFKVQPCKTNILHTQITLSGSLQIFAFNNYRKNHYLFTEGEKSFVIELQSNAYNGKESVRGILRGISIENLTFNDDVAGAGFIKMSIVNSDATPCYATYNMEDLASLVGDNQYGTLIICGSRASYDKLCAEGIGGKITLHEFMYSSLKNNYSRVIVSPEFDDELWMNGYDKIIFLDRPLNLYIISYLNEKTKAKVYIPRNFGSDILKDVSLDRKVFAFYYEAFRRNSDIISPTIWSYYKALSSRVVIGLKQFMTCLIVFVDLGFISIGTGDFCLKFNKDVRADLGASALYRSFMEYKKAYGQYN